MKHKFARGVRAFASDQAGVAAIEFSFLAWPFFGVVLMILNSFVVQYFRNSLDGAVSNLASDLRSGSFILKDATMVASSVRGGGVVVSVSALRARLQTYLPVGMDVNKVLIESFARTNCSTNGGCWDDAYSDLTHGVRKSPTFNVNSTLSNLQISGSSSGSPAVQFGVAGASQYLVVYYPMSPFSTIFTGNALFVKSRLDQAAQAAAVAAANAARNVVQSANRAAPAFDQAAIDSSALAEGRQIGANIFNAQLGVVINGSAAAPSVVVTRVQALVYISLPGIAPHGRNLSGDVHDWIELIGRA